MPARKTARRERDMDDLSNWTDDELMRAFWWEVDTEAGTSPADREASLDRYSVGYFDGFAETLHELQRRLREKHGDTSINAST